MNRTFDYRPRLDPRNLPHRVSLTDPPVVLENTSRFWVPGPNLDQGREGACVGFGCTAEAMASPARVRFPERQRGGTALAHAMAGGVYRRAREIDEWEGVDYEGTSVRAGMLVGREYGWWEGFRWALNMPELRAALDLGPVVIGVEWRSGMYRAPGGWLTPQGDVVGGHCILVTGYTRDKAYRLRNSWGEDFGIRGSCYIRAADLKSILFDAGGEAAVPVGRTA